ncbi:hypothetical protein BGX38DRAFT_1144676 [Terfezia claveryi]|nr:hypothetical protein BGX38DRAFT_1144676 [Terfezia claveryi]
MANFDSLKDWLDRNPDAEVVDGAASAYDAYDYDIASITHSSKERTDYIKQGTEFASEQFKLGKEIADKYTTLAFKNLRRSVLQTIMSDGGPNSAARKVRRQTIAAVLGEEAWKDVESQYDIVGPAWDDAETVTRALGALELADSKIPHDEWDAWRQISPSSRGTFPDVPQRIQWLEKQGYITDCMTSSYEPGYFPTVVAWLYFGFLTILAFWALKWLCDKFIWTWNRIRYGQIFEEFESTPPKKRKRKTVKKPTGNIMRPVRYNLEYHDTVEDEVMPKSMKSVIVVQNSRQGNKRARFRPEPEDYYSDDSQYPENENQAQNNYMKEPESQYSTDSNNEYEENDSEAQEEYYDEGEGYGYEDEEYHAAEDQLEAETVPPRQLVEPVQRGNSSYRYVSPTDTEDTGIDPDTNMETEMESESEGYSGQYKEEDVYTDANEEEDGFGDDADGYSIIEEEVPKIRTSKFIIKPVQQPRRKQSKAPVAKAGPTSKAPTHAATKPLTKASQVQQAVPPRKRR